MCIYISAYAWSWGPLGWLYSSEVQPLETRSAGQSITTLVNLMFSFVIGQVRILGSSTARSVRFSLDRHRQGQACLPDAAALHMWRLLLWQRLPQQACCTWCACMRATQLSATGRMVLHACDRAHTLALWVN